MKKGTGKYNGMLSFKCFSYGNIGYYASRCPNKSLNHKHKEKKVKMINKIYYIREDEIISNDESNNGDDDDEFLFMDLKDDFFFTNSKRSAKESPSETKHKNERTLASTFHSRLEKNYWIIESGCSNHMTSDKSNFVKHEKYDGGFFRFGYDTSAKIFGKGSINFDGKHNTNDVYYVKGLKNNLLSFGKMCSKGYDIKF